MHPIKSYQSAPFTIFLSGGVNCYLQTFSLQVLLLGKALLTARGSTLGKQLASGGVVQIKSSEDVSGLCDSKFNVSGGTEGLVNILGEWIERIYKIWLYT